MDTSKDLRQSINFQKKIKKIGLFDSGIGGLTILAPLIQQFPAEYIYVADNEHVPYGNKSTVYIIERALKIIQFLVEHEVDIIIIPCNTAYCASYQAIQNYFPQVIVINIVDPILPYVIKQTLNKRVGIMATEVTIKSGVYQQKLRSLDRQLIIFDQPCPGLALAIEQNDDNRIDSLLQLYTKDMHTHEIDTLLLACTHYGLIIERIRKIINSIQVISIHEHSEELLMHAVPKILSSTLSLFMGKCISSDDKRIQLLFPEFIPIEIRAFNH